MSTAVFEHSYYIGNYMSGILYGVDMVMYFATVQQLFRRKRQGLGWKFFFCYSTAMFLLLTLDISVNAVWGENMWITYRDRPGGPSLFLATQLSDWYQAMGSSAAVALVFMSDALLIYRLFVIFGHNYYILILPILAYIASFICAVLELVTSFTPGGFFFGSSSVNFGVPYYSITIGLNILVTGAICYRLLSISSAVKRTMGAENAKVYTGVMSILVESALPYSLFGIIFLVPYARGSLTAVAFGQVWAKMTCIAPQLIVLRVVSGKGWSRETISQTRTGFGFASRRTAPSAAFTLSNMEKGSTGTTYDSTLAESVARKDGSSKTTLEHEVV